MEISELRTEIVSGEYQIPAELVAKAVIEWINPTILERDPRGPDGPIPPPSS